ncbi:hypothetical protein DFH07DRAFT_977990 [Mycena maculata]|uniref:MYND-type domain-containing protein n=1 Tax=Mycena maculata TaxID=230809 RepID=A0AAD7ILV5_9AGAR|nr:hypothetical protein DFH07DRAFT_977990 [Mycena maculata]
MFEERLEVLDLFQSRTYLSYKACDNLDCSTNLGHKSHFKRCSSCERAYYCSFRCQTVDWKQGGHREICQHLRSIRLREPPLSPRETSFLRLVMDRTYERTRVKTVWGQQIMFMIENPGVPFYTSFDLSKGTDVVITVQAVPTLAGGDEQSRNWAVLWKVYAARLARSAGKMDLHLLVVGEGKGVRMRLMAMRSSSAATHEAKIHIVAEVAAGRLNRVHRQRVRRARSEGPLEKGLIMGAVDFGSVKQFKATNKGREATRPDIDRVLTFDSVKGAFEYFDARVHAGKVVIKVSLD